MKLLNILNGTIIVEVSEKLKKQLITKFSAETQDDAKTISQYIDEFERFTQSIPADKRDLTRYDYKTLKSLIDSKTEVKKRKSDIETAFKKIKEAEPKTPSAELAVALKKFFEIQSEIKGENKNPVKMGYLKLRKFIDEKYEDLITQKLLNKFRTENQLLTTEQILFYITNYIRNYQDLLKKPAADTMNFSQFEQMIDALVAEKGMEEKVSSDVKDIDMVYDDNNLIIFAPKTKDQCIKLGYGRTWCTSRLGATNLYYLYRFGKDRTLYYVIDKDKNYEDRYFASVILVDPYGRTAFADKTNSPPYHGDTNLPWSEISGFIPKLANLQDLFVSRPLSKDEIEMRDKYSNTNYDHRRGGFGDKSLIEVFNSPREIELWMELNSKELTDEDYASLTQELKKKYVALGFDLTPRQIASSEAAVLNYYARQKIEKIKNSSLNQLDPGDIALLNSPIFAKTKESLKEKFAEGLTVKNESKFVMNGTNDGNVGRFIGLYGFDEIFEALPQSLVSINIVGDGPGGTPLTIPRGITRFKNLNSLTLQKNAISELPDYICELKDLSFLGLTNNPELTSLPECIGDLEDLDILNLSGTNVQSLPKKLEERMTDMGNGIYNIFDF
jgi:hypothetical protein